MRVDLEAAGFLAKEPSEDLEALDEALNKLAAEDPAKAELVKLRFFAGLTMPEIARVMKISLATAERHWTYARTWLYAELKDRGDSARSLKIFLEALRGFARFRRIEDSERTRPHQPSVSEGWRNPRALEAEPCRSRAVPRRRASSRPRE